MMVTVSTVDGERFASGEQIVDYGAEGRLFCLPKGISREEAARAIKALVADKGKQTANDHNVPRPAEEDSAAQSISHEGAEDIPPQAPDNHLEGSEIEHYSLVDDPVRGTRVYLNIRVHFRKPLTQKEAERAFCEVFQLCPEAVIMVGSINPKTPTKTEAGELKNPAPILATEDRFRSAIFHVPFEGEEPQTRTYAAATLSMQLGLAIQPGHIELKT